MLSYFSVSCCSPPNFEGYAEYGQVLVLLRYGCDAHQATICRGFLGQFRDSSLSFHHHLPDLREYLERWFWLMRPSFIAIYEDWEVLVGSYLRQHLPQRLHPPDLLFVDKNLFLLSKHLHHWYPYLHRRPVCQFCSNLSTFWKRTYSPFDFRCQSMSYCLEVPG